MRVSFGASTSYCLLSGIAIQELQICTILNTDFSWYMDYGPLLGVNIPFSVLMVYTCKLASYDCCSGCSEAMPIKY